MARKLSFDWDWVFMSTKTKTDGLQFSLGLPSFQLQIGNIFKKRTYIEHIHYVIILCAFTLY